MYGGHTDDDKMVTFCQYTTSYIYNEPAIYTMNHDNWSHHGHGEGDGDGKRSSEQ